MAIPPRREAGPVALMIAILQGLANLRGALCVADPAAHDRERWPEEPRPEPRRLADATAQCRRCPARELCREWARALPPGSITGITPRHPGTAESASVSTTFVTRHRTPRPQLALASVWDEIVESVPARDAPTVRQECDREQRAHAPAHPLDSSDITTHPRRDARPC